VVLFLGVPFWITMATLFGMKARWLMFGLCLTISIMMSINFIGALIGLRFDELKKLLEEKETVSSSSLPFLPTFLLINRQIEVRRR
jgi:hypothetical protein